MGQIEEVIEPFETMLVQHLHKHVPNQQVEYELITRSRNKEEHFKVVNTSQSKLVNWWCSKQIRQIASKTLNQTQQITTQNCNTVIWLLY